MAEQIPKDALDCLRNLLFQWESVSPGGKQTNRRRAREQSSGEVRLSLAGANRGRRTELSTSGN